MIAKSERMCYIIKNTLYGGAMKRFIALLIAILTIAFPITSSAAGNVYQTAGEYVFTNEDTTLPYRLVLPEGYDESKSYPLIMFFHGAGERGNNNSSQLFHCVQYLADNLPECIIVAPQCPVNNQWVDTPWANGSYSTDAVPESNEMKASMELLNKLQEEYSLDSDRIYAAGISMGGFAAWNALMLHNDIFAAGIAICGGADPSKAEILVDTPMFVFHGDSDSAVPVSGSREMVQAIKDAGGDKVEYIEYKGADHNIWNDAFATEGLLDKLLECKLSDRIATEESTVSEESVSQLESEASIGVSEQTSESEDGGSATVWIIIGIIVASIAVAAVVFFVFKKK